MKLSPTGELGGNKIAEVDGGLWPAFLFWGARDDPVAPNQCSYVWPFFALVVFPGAGLAGAASGKPVEERRADSKKADVISKASRTDFVSPRSIFEMSAPFNSAR